VVKSAWDLLGELGLDWDFPWVKGGWKNLPSTKTGQTKNKNKSKVQV